MTRVAIVDDDESHRRALGRLLRASGLDEVGFASAEEFLAREPGDGVDCLVLDIQLGGMSGFELQTILAAAGEGPPVIFLTAHDEAETIDRAVATGCPYLRKTEPGSSLLDAIRRIVAPASTPEEQ